MSKDSEIKAKLDHLITLEKEQLTNWLIFVDRSRKNIQLLKDARQGKENVKGVCDFLHEYHESVRAALVKKPKGD